MSMASAQKFKKLMTVVLPMIIRRDIIIRRDAIIIVLKLVYIEFIQDQHFYYGVLVK